MYLPAWRFFRRRRRRVSAGLRLHLVAFALAVLLPGAAFGAWAVGEAVAGQQRAARALLEDTARAIALAMDGEIRARIAAARTLAASPLLDGAGEGCAFHAWASEVGRVHGGWIVVTGAPGPESHATQRVNTRLPCGAPLPVVGPDSGIREVFRTGRPAVTDLFTGAATGLELAAVVAPVLRDGAVAGAVSLTMEPRDLSARLAGFTGGNEIVVTLVDAAHRVVARSRDAAALLGVEVPPATVAATAGQGAGFLLATSSDGQAMAMGFHRLAVTPGWTVVAGMPAEAYRRAWAGPGGRLVFGQMAALLAVLPLAAWGAGRLLRPIAELTANAGAVLAGREPVPGLPRRSGVRELDRLALCIARAHAAMGRRAGAQRAALAALAREERRTRALAEAGTLVAWRADASGAIVEGHGWQALTGQEDAALRGEGWLAMLHPDDRARAAAAWTAARDERRAVDVEYRVRRPGSPGEWRWVRARGVPLGVLPDGAVEEWVGVVEDAHDRRSHEERQALLAREVDHRAKNALAVVQAALRLTRAPDMPSYVRAVEGRIAALARAHTLLAEDRWTGADLRAIVAGELAPFLGAPGQGPRAVLEGPEIGLPALAAQPLGMAVHELATNAVKHGALSAPEGRVAVRWELEQAPGGGVLRLLWQESGGPALAGPPARRGFGSRVVEGTLCGQLGGGVRLDWAASGLVCEMRVPLRRGAKAAA